LGHGVGSSDHAERRERYGGLVIFGDRYLLTRRSFLGGLLTLPTIRLLPRRKRRGVYRDDYSNTY
jgi:hypothetical protein